MFERAHYVTVTGGTFTAIGATTNDSRREGLRFLQHKIAPGAFHNSAERYNPPKCHPHTRQAVLKKIMDWVTDLNKSCLFMWMYGPAGAGKSAIAQTMADICSKAGNLAASFFFCRNTLGRNTETFFVTTLVYQLMLSIPEIVPRVGKVLAEDPLLLSRSLEAQINALIVNPLNESAMDDHDGSNLIMRPKFIIIDGLDECLDPKSQRHILDTLFSAVEELRVPLFFLVTSRPEPHIRDAFNNPLLNFSTIRLALDDTYQPDADITLFLESRFQDIRRKHPSLPPTWPSRSDLEVLVQKSSGQFIYVSTVMKYLDSHNHWPPPRLEFILGLTTTGDGTPFVEIDAIYHHIFRSASDIDKVIDILAFVLMVEFWPKTKTLIEEFFLYQRGEVDIILSNLHSLVGVPSREDEGAELRVWHSSLSDFLFDSSRSGKLFIDTRAASSKFTSYCMGHLRMPNSTLMQDSINIHHLHSLLMVNCAASDPSAQVLKDLYDFDMRSHLQFWMSDDNVVGVYEHDTKRIVNLLMWLKTQHHPTYETDLFQHHLDPIDEWISQSLGSYPSDESKFDEFLAAGILTKFLSDEMFAVLGTEPVMKSGFTRARRSDPLQIYSRDKEYAMFYSLLTEFLLNRERAAEYFVHGRKFASLALRVLKFLDSDDKSTDIERFAVNLLSPILLKSSKSPELAAELFSHPLCWPPAEGDALYIEKLQACQAIEHYLERRDLPSINDLPSTNNLPSTSVGSNILLRLPPGSTISMPVMPVNAMSPDERLRFYAGRATLPGSSKLHPH